MSIRLKAAIQRKLRIVVTANDTGIVNPLADRSGNGTSEDNCRDWDFGSAGPL
jgi:hypothetical protein